MPTVKDYKRLSYSSPSLMHFLQITLDDYQRHVGRQPNLIKLPVFRRVELPPNAACLLGITLQWENDRQTIELL